MESRRKRIIKGLINDLIFALGMIWILYLVSFSLLLMNPILTFMGNELDNGDVDAGLQMFVYKTIPLWYLLSWVTLSFTMIWKWTKKWRSGDSMKLFYKGQTMTVVDGDEGPIPFPGKIIKPEKDDADNTLN